MGTANKIMDGTAAALSNRLLDEISATQLIHANQYPYRLAPIGVGRRLGLQQAEEGPHGWILVVGLPDGIELNGVGRRGDDGSEMDVVEMERLSSLRYDGSAHPGSDQSQHRVNLGKRLDGDRRNTFLRKKFLQQIMEMPRTLLRKKD